MTQDKIHSLFQLHTSDLRVIDFLSTVDLTCNMPPALFLCLLKRHIRPNAMVLLEMSVP